MYLIPIHIMFISYNFHYGSLSAREKPWWYRWKRGDDVTNNIFEKDRTTFTNNQLIVKSANKWSKKLGTKLSKDRFLKKLYAVLLTFDSSKIIKSILSLVSLTLIFLTHKSLFSYSISMPLLPTQIGFTFTQKVLSLKLDVSLYRSRPKCPSHNPFELRVLFIRFLHRIKASFKILTVLFIFLLFFLHPSILFILD